MRSPASRRSREARSQRRPFALPAPLLRYVAVKGSICIDGVSLTVNDIAGDRVGLNLIRHTVAATTFRHRRAGDAVNVEVDLVVDPVRVPGALNGVLAVERHADAETRAARATNKGADVALAAIEIVDL